MTNNLTIIIWLSLLISIGCTTPAKPDIETAKGILLPGSSWSNAIRSAKNYEADLKTEDLQIIDGIYERHLSGSFSNSATVGQVNKALRKTGVRITGTSENSPIVFLMVPPPGGLKELEKYSEALQKSGAFESVGPEILEEPME